MNVSSVLLFISFCINVVTNLSYQSRIAKCGVAITEPCLCLGRASLRLRDILGSGGDCGSEHFLCDDGNTCCELGGSCCPDPGSNTGTGCCEYDNVGLHSNIEDAND